MKAVVVHGPGDIRYENLPLPLPGPGEALVKTSAAGICSSDVPRALGNAAYSYPIVLGHEVAGEIAELARDVEGVRVGDRCAVAPLLPYSAPFPGYGWHACLSYIARGQLETEPLITHRLTLRGAKEAFMMMNREEEFLNKVMFVEGGEDEVQG